MPLTRREFTAAAASSFALTVLGCDSSAQGNDCVLAIKAPGFKVLPNSQEPFAGLAILAIWYFKCGYLEVIRRKGVKHVAQPVHRR
jgi:hypothetical protein